MSPYGCLQQLIAPSSGTDHKRHINSESADRDEQQMRVTVHVAFTQNLSQIACDALERSYAVLKTDGQVLNQAWGQINSHVTGSAVSVCRALQNHELVVGTPPETSEDVPVARVAMPSQHCMSQFDALHTLHTLQL